MDNNKLGLKIVRINQGYTDLLEINGDQTWTKNVWDIRKDLENIDNLDGSSAVLMLTSVDTGHILTVASLIEGRITDCISAWVYVPSSINITGKELVEILDVVKKEILANERNDDRLAQLFCKSYEAAPATRITVKGYGDKCAFRYYGQGAKYTLSELLKDMCQSYYKNYKSIFLLDNSSNLKCTQGDNLSDQKVYSMVVVKSPGKVDSFDPYVGEQPFGGQMYAVEGDVIKIEWRRNGYLPILTETTVRQDMRYSVPMPNQYMRVIPFESIKVVDEWGQSIREYELYVANKLIENGCTIAISESTINNVRIEIYAEGFEPISGNVNLVQPVKIKLAKETYAYEFMLPLKNEEGYYSIKISGNRKLKNSPIEGYVPEGGYVTRNQKNYLRFKPFNRKFWITCLICSIVVLVLGFCGGYAFSDFLGERTDREEISKLKKENSELNKKISDFEKRNYKYTPKGTTNNIGENSTDDAIAYLEQNNVWNRTDMEKYDVLKGLWDALNERRFDDILKYEDNITSSSVFKEVIVAIKANRNKKFEGNFNRNANDFDITIKPDGDKKGYIKALEDAVTTEKSKKSSTTGATKKSQPKEPQKSKTKQGDML